MSTTSRSGSTERVGGERRTVDNPYCQYQHTHEIHGKGDVVDLGTGRLETTRDTIGSAAVVRATMPNASTGPVNGAAGETGVWPEAAPGTAFRYMDVDHQPAENKPILVTGATGFIGLEVCRQLDAAGIPTRAMVRRRHRTALIAPLDVELAFADLESPDAIRAAVDGCRAIIHLAGRATFEPYDRLARTVVKGSELILQAAHDCGIERIVHGSSLFVHGPDDGPTITAESPTRPVLDYGRAKLEAEAMLEASPVSTIAVRLPHVYGWNDLLFGTLRSGYLPFPAKLDGRFPRLHVTDAARALIAAAENHEVSGPWPVADDLTVTWRHFFEVVTTYLPTARIINLPPAPITAGLRLIDRLPLHKPTMLAADTIRGWNLEQVLNPGSLKPLGIDPLFPTVDHGVPAVLNAALPYRWRHPVFDRRPA